MKILLDTNFIISSLKKKIDIEDEINRLIDEKVELILLETILRELEKFSRNKEKKIEERKLAQVFLKMIKNKNISIKIYESKQKNPDEAIRVFCLKNKNCILATLDKELRKKITNKILTIKKNKIEFA